MCPRFIEFFESDAGPLSMSRLLMLGSFVVTAFIMIALTLRDGMTEAYFGTFIMTFSGTYLVGKGIDVKMPGRTGGKTE